MVFVCHVTLQDHLTKGSCKFKGRNPLIHLRAKFGGHRHCSRGDMDILANTVILPQIPDIRGCICPVTSTTIIFSKAYGMPYFTHVSNNNLKNNSYGNFFNVANEISLILITRLLGNE